MIELELTKKRLDEHRLRLSYVRLSNQGYKQCYACKYNGLQDCNHILTVADTISPLHLLDSEFTFNSSFHSLSPAPSYAAYEP